MRHTTRRRTCQVTRSALIDIGIALATAAVICGGFVALYYGAGVR